MGYIVPIYFACFFRGYAKSFYWNHVIHLPTSFKVASLALVQSYDCPSGSEITLKDMDKIVFCQTITKQNKMRFF